MNRASLGVKLRAATLPRALLIKLHVYLLVVHDQKQTNLAFTQASCLVEGERVNPSRAANFTMPTSL